MTVEGVRSTFVKRVFADDSNFCCGSKVRVRRVEVTLYGRDECHPTWLYVNQCTGGCAAAYYANKKTSKGETDAEDVTWHCFYPWTSDDVPKHLTNQSGRSLMSTELINDVELGD